ncbi:unnamed protein product [Blepharisma stoltei]|uniref:C2H2-type domain-containing protein n=1 Tax=Blepharisma stoltei TaxID=1481888 RepID=A0AAU9IXM1_9CILI|nr:unnamed protein product [Blepharisma stoltei]
MDLILKSELCNMFIWPYDNEIPHLPLIGAFGDESSAEIQPSFPSKILNFVKVDCSRFANLKNTVIRRKILCEICGRSFKNYKGLRQHSGKLHSKIEKIHQCEICDKKFNSKFCAKYHMEQVHQDVKKVKCLQCGLTLYNKYAFKKHSMLVHPSSMLDE